MRTLLSLAAFCMSQTRLNKIGCNASQVQREVAGAVLNHICAYTLSWITPRTVSYIAPNLNCTSARLYLACQFP